MRIRRRSPQASGTLDVLPFERATMVYARVDGCIGVGRLVLMELELLEPGLFLAMRPGGAMLFADAIGVAR